MFIFIDRQEHINVNVGMFYCMDTMSNEAVYLIEFIILFKVNSIGTDVSRALITEISYLFRIMYVNICGDYRCDNRVCM